VTHDDLEALSGALVPYGQTCPRYPIERGIPVLIPQDEGLPKQERRIISAFSTRSATYFTDNYAGAIPERARRYRLVEDFAQTVVEPNMLVGDIGAGPAVFAELVERLDGRYVAVDLSVANLLEGRRRVPSINAVVASVNALPFRDAVFDFVVATGCLEYVRAQQQAIHELVRVTKPGGYLVVSFANALNPRRWWEEAVVHRLRRIARTAMGHEDVYSRRLTRPATALSDVTQAGGEIRDVCPVEDAVLGNSSALPFMRPRSTDRNRRGSRADWRAAEFLVVAQRVSA
jgi:SAM-dependent methyltransferase